MRLRTTVDSIVKFFSGKRDDISDMNSRIQELQAENEQLAHDNDLLRKKLDADTRLLSALPGKKHKDESS